MRTLKTASKMFFQLSVAMLFMFCSSLFAQSFVDSISIYQLTDGSGIVRVCYKAHNVLDTTIAVNMQAATNDSGMWDISVLTILDTLSAYSSSLNHGWRVSASTEGVWHCFLWDMGSDIGSAERCGFQARFAVFDSILSEFGMEDSFMIMDTLAPMVQAFGLAYRHGYLWVLFHNDSTHDCWIRQYSMPDIIPGDSFYIGTVTIGPSDMAFVGDRLFWVEDTRVLLKEFDFETGESNVVRGDWWDLPGTSNHLAGAAFDGENLWVCFCEGTFIALDTADFSLVDTMFFSDFGLSVPATCADGLAWGLGLLWCFSNDNIVYGIDTKSKSIVYEIPTGAVVLATGAEGAAWDGVNLWVVDYGRGYLYQLSLFGQVRFYRAPQFCFDNIPPRLDWNVPACPDFADTFVADDTTELAWSAIDSNLSGGTTVITTYDDTIAIQPSSDTTFLWSVFPWPGFDATFNLSTYDSLGNASTLTSCLFYITSSGIENNLPKPDELSISVTPNPFNSSCVITVKTGTVPTGQNAQIEICDLQGRVVCVPSFSPPKEHNYIREEHTRNFIWTPEKSLPSGIYLLRAKMEDGQMMSKKMVLVR